MLGYLWLELEIMSGFVLCASDQIAYKLYNSELVAVGFDRL